MGWIEKDIADFVYKCPNFHQANIEHLKPSRLIQEMGDPTWKCEETDIDFILGLP